MASHWRTAIGVCVLALGSGLPATPAAGQGPGQPARELAWIGLFNDELGRWLDNANRLKELCTAPESSNVWHACKAATLEPRLIVIPVRSEPLDTARRMGEIVILALPGQGLKAISSSGRVAGPFTPDLFDPDWGYGPPWFHQSILERRGSWFRVPVPSIGAGWIDADGWHARDRRAPGDTDDRTITLEAGDIITTPQGHMVVLSVDADGVLRLRPEQESDMWCKSGDPPPLAPWQEIRVPFDQLRDARGHLLVQYRYTRGC